MVTVEAIQLSLLHYEPKPYTLETAGYVEQFDTLLPELTVFEMLMYTAELKQPRSVPLQVRSLQPMLLIRNTDLI